MPTALLLMAVFYILAGVNHFVLPKFYVRMIPRYLPYRRTLNLLAGVAEIAFGTLLCFAETRSLGAWLIIGLLVAFIPVHVHMLQDRNVVPFAPAWLLWARLAFQAVLIAWAAQYV